MVRDQIQEASDRVEEMTGQAGKYGIGIITAGLAVVGHDRPKLAGGLALVVGGVLLLAYGMVSRFMESMGMA